MPGGPRRLHSANQLPRTTSATFSGGRGIEANESTAWKGESTVRDFVFAAVTLTVFALPFILTFAYLAYRLFLRNKQIEMILAERRLLIEQGVTDLPPLEAPVERRASSFRNLAAGLFLLFIAAALALDYALRPHEPFMGPFQQTAVLIAGSVGLALVIIHFIARAYASGEPGSQALGDAEPPPEGPSQGD